MITTPEQMAEALRQAKDGTITGPGMMAAIAPWEHLSTAINSMLFGGQVPTGAVLLMFSLFVGALLVDEELQGSQIPVEDRLTLFALHATIGYQHVKQSAQDPTFFAAAGITPPAQQPSPRDEAKEKRALFHLIDGGKPQQLIDPEP